MHRPPADVSESRVESPERLAARYHIEKSRRAMRALSVSSLGAACFMLAQVVTHWVKGTWSYYDWVFGAAVVFFLWSAVSTWRASRRRYEISLDEIMSEKAAAKRERPPEAW